VERIRLLPLGAWSPDLGRAILMRHQLPSAWPVAWRRAVRCLPELAPEPALLEWAGYLDGRDTLLAGMCRARWEAAPWSWEHVFDAARVDDLYLLLTDCPLEQAVTRAFADMLRDRLREPARASRIIASTIAPHDRYFRAGESRF